MARVPCAGAPLDREAARRLRPTSAGGDPRPPRGGCRKPGGDDDADPDPGGAPAGFYTLERISNDEVELGHLFIEPTVIGRGLGRLLVEHACAAARRLGFRTMVVQGDPNAEGFYLRVGARPVGSRPSVSIPGRDLPLFRLDLDP